MLARCGSSSHKASIDLTTARSLASLRTTRKRQLRRFQSPTHVRRAGKPAAGLFDHTPGPLDQRPVVERAAQRCVFKADAHMAFSKASTAAKRCAGVSGAGESAPPAKGMVG
jgi:hypothetical protein